MARRKPRREPGRPTLLDQDVETKLVEATKIGTPMNAAAAYVGISTRTFEDWMRRGHAEQVAREEGEEPDEVEAKYLELYEKVVRARASATVASIGLIRKAAVGGQVTEETTRRYRDTDGQVVEEKTVKKTAPDWRASAWWLERQQRPEFGRAVEVNQQIGGTVNVSVKADELASRIAMNLERAKAAHALPAGPSSTSSNAGSADIVDAEVVTEG